MLVWSVLFPQEATPKWEGFFPIIKVQGPLTYEIQCRPWKHDTKVQLPMVSLQWPGHILWQSPMDSHSYGEERLCCDPHLTASQQ